MTAVEELKIKLIFNSIVKEKLNGKVSFTIGLSKLDEIFKQAKELEKQQIIEARITAPLLPSIDKSIYLNEAEQYYNENFKSE